MVRVTTPSGATNVHWSGHQVLHENEVLQVIGDGAQAQVAISGHLLTGAGGPLTSPAQQPR
jgi:hypothetical protein